MRTMARSDYEIAEATEEPINIEFSKIKVENEVSVRFAMP